MVVLPESFDGLLSHRKTSTLIVSIAVVIITSVALSTLTQYSRLRHIKGPAFTGISRWWLLSHITGGRMHLDLYDACLKYGDIVRIGPNELVTSDPALVKRMLNVRTPYKRAYWYFAMRFDPSRDNVLSMRDDAQHNALRAKMAHGYSGKEVENLECSIDDNVRSLIRLIEKYVVEDKAFDFGRKAQFFTLDVISTIAFGKAFGFLSSDTDLFEYCRTFEEQMPGIIATTVYPWLVNVLQWPIIKSAMPSDKDPIGFGRIIGIARKVADERYRPDAKVQKDMLGSFIAHGLSREEGESETLLQIIAGSDTTATAVRATMLYVMINTRVITALRAEMASLGPASADSIISDAQARAMPYLQAIIKEGLRIHPTVVGLQPKEVPPGGDVWNGVALPAGTDVGICYWGLMRRPEIWGDDAAEFRPERWLEAPPARLREMEATWELVFGFGRWQCLGKNVALMELNKVFVELFRRFEFALVNPTDPWRSFNAGVFIQRDFWMKAYRRD